MSKEFINTINCFLFVWYWLFMANVFITWIKFRPISVLGMPSYWCVWIMIICGLSLNNYTKFEEVKNEIL